MKNEKPIDQEMTIDIKNEELIALLDAYMADKSAENLNALMNKITGSRILVPSNLNEQKQPVPVLLKNKEGDNYIPVYTNKEQIPEKPKSQAIVNLPYMVANHMAADPKLSICGIVVNPFGQNLIFKEKLIQKVEEVEKNKKENARPKEIKLTEQQYVFFERRRFEAGTLPKHLFEEGKEFLDKLCEEKEEYVDQLHEDTYQQKRLYPFLPEDYSVMPMNVSEGLLFVRVDMPTRDMTKGACYRVYLVWDSERNLGKYYMIEGGNTQQEVLLTEVTADRQMISHGQAPAEGAELQTILDMVKGSGDLTS